jgi:hypothetical protein
MGRIQVLRCYPAPLTTLHEHPGPRQLDSHGPRAASGVLHALRRGSAVMSYSWDNRLTTMSTMTAAEVLAELAVNGLQLPPAELRAKLMMIWPLQHGPLHHYRAATLIALFKRAGYVSDGPLYPDESLIIYRGQIAGAASIATLW